MNIWRMAFRVGANGDELWPTCEKLGIAAITYPVLSETDLSKYPRGEPKALWSKLESSQKFSLGAIAYEMKKGDVIYVKQGPYIVGRGVISGEYRFDHPARIVDSNDVDWPHYVPVDWQRNFLKVKLLFGAELSTVKRLTPENLAALYKALGKNPDGQ